MSPPTAPPLPKIRLLAIDDENQILVLIKMALEKVGYSVTTLSDPTKVVETALRERPELIVSDLMMPKLDGYGVVRALRANPETALIPVAILSAAPANENVPKAFTSGVVGYFEKPFHPVRLAQQLRQLLADVSARKNQLQGSLRRTPMAVLVTMMAHQHRSGVLVLKDQSQNEGRAVFKDGKLIEAVFQKQVGPDAIKAMSELSEGDFFLSNLDGVASELIEITDIAEIIEADVEPLPEIKHVVAVVAASKEKVLVTDDDESTVTLMKRAFIGAGYECESATNGQAGLAVAIHMRPDLIISDLMMPIVDGWQLYNQVRADFRVNEARFLFLSGYIDFNRKLREAGIQADGFVAKGTVLSQILARSAQLLAPRRDFRAMLARGNVPKFSSRSEPLGIKFVLRALARNGFNGTLSAENIWHKLQCALVRGQPVSCQDTGLVPVQGKEAFVALCGLTSAELMLDPTPSDKAANLTGAMLPLIEEAEQLLTKTEQRVLDTNLVTATNLRIDEETLSFYATMAPVRLQPVLQALVARKSPRDIIAEVDLPATEIEEALRDLVRKRIILFEA